MYRSDTRGKRRVGWDLLDQPVPAHTACSSNADMGGSWDHENDHDKLDTRSEKHSHVNISAACVSRLCTAARKQVSFVSERV